MDERPYSAFLLGGVTHTNIHRLRFRIVEAEKKYASGDIIRDRIITIQFIGSPSRGRAAVVCHRLMKSEAMELLRTRFRSGISLQSEFQGQLTTCYAAAKKWNETGEALKPYDSGNMTIMEEVEFLASKEKLTEEEYERNVELGQQLEREHLAPEPPCSTASPAGAEKSADAGTKSPPAAQ